MGCTCEPLALRLPCGEARAGSEPHRRVEDPPEGRAPAQARSHLARCSGMSGAPEHPERRAHWGACACVAHTEHTDAPAVLFVPLAHATHDVAPAVSLKRPAAHAQHAVAPAKSVNFPAGHALHPPPPALPELPAAHCDSDGTVKLSDVLPLTSVPLHRRATAHDAP